MGYTPVLLESFVDEREHAGTSYRAANWQRIGETTGRGRQDRYHEQAAGRKAIYLLPLTPGWRQALYASPARPLRLPPAPRDEEAPVTLSPPRGKHGPKLRLWAVHALEPTPPPETEAVEWRLLTTVAVEDFAQACERLSWYAVRWSIEIFHRTLKSGCRIEDRRLAEAGHLQACLALDRIVAWRVLYLTRLGRQTPDLPCDVFFEEEEWKALCAYHHKSATPPPTPPTLGEAVGRVAKIGGFLGRKGDGSPGATALWRGLDKLSFLTELFRIFHAQPCGP